MIKECDIILQNNKVAVVLFDRSKIQIPHSEIIGDKAYIKYENGKYTVVPKEDFNKQKLNAKVKTKKNSNDENKDLISVIDNEEQGYNGL